ncbi:YceD family protein [Lentilactobacillus sp. Marseille-Q4993]|uniref:YceD family protein n=1 Tax=Lentilactobacillus sp. Marseille-Q4993 TaxID=3039492 RepID=UPI0024BC5280|nr:YceD family protein [Lentilactobacillus sp. Marseille-Q4993]
MELLFRELQKYPGSAPFQFSEKMDIKADLLDRYPDQVIDASSFQVSGITFADNGDVTLSLDIKGKLVVPSSRSLTPVDLPLDFNVTEFYVPSKAAEAKYEDDDVVFVLDESDEVDLKTSVIDNVILQIPMQVLSPEEKSGATLPSGKDWNVVTADDFEREKADTKKVDPRLAKLKDFFKEDK